MSHGVMSMLPSLGMGQRQPAKKAGKLSILFRPEDHVPMVGHQHPVEDADRRPFVGEGKNLLEGEEILILLEQPEPAA